MDIFATHITNNEAETLTVAAQLAKSLNNSDIVMLNGPLGAGKSVMARGIIQNLSHTPDEDIPSPTFTLVQQYDTIKGTLWHYDLYRLEHAEEIYETGWEDFIGQDIIIIEWAERLKHLTPHQYIKVDIDPIDKEKRNIKIQRIGK